jgi:asparagine synthase (glutamine-hydrolysing)
MCGIFAVISKRNSTFSQDFNLLKHRGPDDSQIIRVGKFYGNNVIFGFHRLAVVDMDPKSSQPISYDGAVLICNGEIYNYKYLIDLYGLEMTTGSDCEVILQLYLKFGRSVSALHRTMTEINGEFAFVMFDIKFSRLFAGRDVFGVRPLFYGKHGLASELKALSFCKEVFPFPPAHFMVYEINNIKLYRYSCFFAEIKTYGYEEMLRKIRHMLVVAVKDRMISARPVGAFLSGGVDSSLIVAILSEFIPDLTCFSIGINEESEDIKASRKVVEYLNKKGRNINHKIAYFSTEEGFEVIPELIWQLETYDITTIRASVPQYILSKYIAKNTDIKVLFSGEGADENFNSYLYSKLAPNPQELDEDRTRLLNELYLYDNLRVDRTTASFGLEVRIPFLDTRFVKLISSFGPEVRMCTDKIEKKILRDAFVGFLPDEILYRQKNAFSDAVSSADICWYKSISDRLKSISEKDYYKKIFDEIFPGRSNILPAYWMPRWIDTNGDPSATALPFY